MDKLSDIYYRRQSCLERNQVPTLSEIRKYMKPRLADVYLKSMNHPSRVLVGLEPPLKGGGDTWYVPPKDHLESKAVLRPEKRKYIDMLSSHTIIMYGETAVKLHINKIYTDFLEDFRKKNETWIENIRNIGNQIYENQTILEENAYNIKLKQAMDEFEVIYINGLTDLEELLMEAALNNVNRIKDGIYQRKCEEYKKLLKDQSLRLSKTYDDKLIEEKTRLKRNFLDKVAKYRHDVGLRIHDLRADKHVAIEKLRHLLRCRTVACQVYVAFKERDECNKDLSKSVREHKKLQKEMTQKIYMQDFEIKLEMEKLWYAKKLKELWTTKTRLVMAKLQELVLYCLRELPEAADFFLNLEKLVLLQMIQAEVNNLQNINEASEFEASNAKPHPYYLFYDKGTQNAQNIEIHEALCPVHCTSSASLFPVIVINKQCMYAACDNFEVSFDQIKKYFQGDLGDDNDLKDAYEYDIPVTFTESQQLKDLKLESSLINVIQNEIIKINKNYVGCKVCKLPFCFTVSTPSETLSSPVISSMKSESIISSGRKISRSQELFFDRGPKWESYLNYVLPKKCLCPLMMKRHLEEHLPPYMKKRSKFENLEIPNYKKCEMESLKTLTARSKRPPLKSPVITNSLPRDVGTQYGDETLHFLSCECYANIESYVADIQKKLRKELSTPLLFTADEFLSKTQSYLMQSSTKFAEDRAQSLGKVIGSNKELLEILKSRF